MRRTRSAQTGLARTLRRNPTEAEKLLWVKLRQVRPHEFRRQEPIGCYFVDFVSYKNKLIIEVDGGQHNEAAGIAKDKERSEWLESRGFRVLRFWNNDILSNIEGVIAEVLRSV